MVHAYGRPVRLAKITYLVKLIALYNIKVTKSTKRTVLDETEIISTVAARYQCMGQYTLTDLPGTSKHNVSPMMAMCM